MPEPSALRLESDRLIFDPIKHEYFIGQKRLPSVTEVLRDLRLIDDTWFTEAGRQRGTDVHAATVLLDEGDLDRASINEETAPYVHAYERFLLEHRPSWEYTEHRVCHYEEYYDAVGITGGPPVVNAYAGTLDRAGLIGPKRVVLDIKTGAYGAVGLQTAAYRRALPEWLSWRRAALRLFSDGHYELEMLRDPRDHARWSAALDLWHWRNRT
jgi:hypothetical protein